MNEELTTCILLFLLVLCTLFYVRGCFPAAHVARVRDCGELRSDSAGNVLQTECVGCHPEVLFHAAAGMCVCVCVCVW